MDWTSIFGGLNAGFGSGNLMGGGTSPAGAPLDPSGPFGAVPFSSAGVPGMSPDYAALLNPSMGPNGQFMTVNPGSMGAVTPGAPLAQPGLGQAQVDNLLGPVSGGEAGSMLPVRQAPPQAQAPGQGFTAEQAALLSKLAGQGQAVEPPRPPGAAPATRLQPPGMTQISIPRLSPARGVLAVHNGVQRANAARGG